jgi:hypothetical protein
MRLGHEDFCKFVELASIPLRQLGPDMLPGRIASGCLVDYRGQRWVFTVAHAMENTGNWAIEVGYEPGRGTKLYKIGQLSFVARYDRTTGGSFETLDMAYTRVPSDLQPRWQPSNEQGQIIHDQPRIILSADLQAQPRGNEEYGFAGNVEPTIETHFGDVYVGTKAACYMDLQFVREENEFYLFKLPFDRPGDLYFRGTSGSPICDREGNVVALVCGPGDTPDTIRGIKIGYFRSALDVEPVGPANKC